MLYISSKTKKFPKFTLNLVWCNRCRVPIILSFILNVVWLAINVVMANARNNDTEVIDIETPKWVVIIIGRQTFQIINKWSSGWE